MSRGVVYELRANRSHRRVEPVSSSGLWWQLDEVIMAALGDGFQDHVTWELRELWGRLSYIHSRIMGTPILYPLTAGEDLSKASPYIKSP